jgi:DNA repair exonuclease SbcCD ATPase subunit
VKRQRGFIVSMMGWATIIATVAAVGMGIALKIQSARLESAKQETKEVKAQFNQFKTEVAELGRLAQARTDARIAEDKKRKEKADAESKKLRAERSALARRLRDERARTSFVPAAPAGSTSPERAAFNRAALERALQRLDAGVSELVAEGDDAVAGLNAAKEWARR